MGLSASLAELKKIILNKNENVTNIIKTKHKNFKEYTQWAFVPFGTNFFINSQNNYQKIDKKTKMNSC